MTRQPSRTSCSSPVNGSKPGDRKISGAEVVHKKATSASIFVTEPLGDEMKLGPGLPLIFEKCARRWGKDPQHWSGTMRSAYELWLDGGPVPPSMDEN